MSKAPAGWIDTGPVAGREDETPLVLLHGFLGDAGDWSEVAGPLSTTRRCIAFDLPGHGRHPPAVPSADDAFSAVVRWLASRLQERGVERFDALGYSMGGRLALGLLCQFPDRVRRAVTIGASPGLREEEVRADRRELDERRARRLEYEGLYAFLADWYRQPLFREFARSAAFPSAMERRRRGDAEALAAVLRGLSPGAQSYLGEALARSRVPLLLIAGADDEKYVTLNAELAALSPCARTVVVPAAGHCVHLERPGELARIVTEFLDEGEEREHA